MKASVKVKTYHQMCVNSIITAIALSSKAAPKQRTKHATEKTLLQKDLQYMYTHKQDTQKLNIDIC
jgi:hypothetical protein